MYFRMAQRLLTRSTPRGLWKLAWNFGYRGAWAIHKQKARLKRGEFFPPFLYISIINSCNLRCQGCWVDVAAKQERIEVPAISRMIGIAYDKANSPRCKASKWIGIAQTLEHCHFHTVRGYRVVRERPVRKWMEGMAKYMGVAQ